MSKEDLSQRMEITTKGEIGEMEETINSYIDNLQSVFVGNMNSIADGNLDFEVVWPLNMAAEYVERISNRDIPEKITDEYNGDFNEIKDNLNKCIDLYDEDFGKY